MAIRHKRKNSSGYTWQSGDLVEGQIGLNIADGTLHFKKGNGTYVSISEDTGITDVVQDTTPQLGGDLDVNGNKIVSASNGNIALEPNGTGKVTATSNIETTGDVKAFQLFSTQSSGDEGGEIKLAKPATGTTIGGTGVNIDVYQNKLRFWEDGGSNRGAYIDLTAAGNSVGTNLLSGGGGATTLDALSDVVITAAASGDILQYNGTNWVDVPALNLEVGSAGTALEVEVLADSTNAVRYPMFSDVTTGTTPGRIDAGLTYNPSTNTLTTTTFVGDLSGNASTASSASVGSTVTLTADNSTNATNYPLFVNAATGNLSPRTDTGFTYNPSSGTLTTSVLSGATLNGYKETVFGITYNASITPNWSNGTVQTVTLTGNTAFAAPSNMTAGTSLTLIIRQDATGGRTATWNASYKFAGGVPSLSTAISAIDTVNIFYDGTDYLASISKQDTTSTITGLQINAAGELRLADSDSSNYVGFKSPATVSTNKIWTLPSADGTNGQVLTTNGSAALSWATPSSGGNNMILLHSGVEYITVGTGGTSENWTLATAGGISGVSVSTNTFTLPAGTYFLELPYTYSDTGTAYDFRLRNTTDSTDTAVITSNTSSLSGVTKYVYWTFQTHFTIAAPKTFVLRTNSGSFQANMGYTSNGKYTVKIMKY